MILAAIVFGAQTFFRGGRGKGRGLPLIRIPFPIHSLFCVYTYRLHVPTCKAVTERSPSNLTAEITGLCCSWGSHWQWFLGSPLAVVRSFLKNPWLSRLEVVASRRWGYTPLALQLLAALAGAGGVDLMFNGRTTDRLKLLDAIVSSTRLLRVFAPPTAACSPDRPSLQSLY